MPVCVLNVPVLVVAPTDRGFGNLPIGGAVPPIPVVARDVVPHRFRVEVVACRGVGDTVARFGELTPEVVLGWAIPLGVLPAVGERREEAAPMLMV